MVIGRRRGDALEFRMAERGEETSDIVTATVEGDPRTWNGTALSAGDGFRESASLIFGYPKSGTTLLLALLDGHPQLTVLPEETRYMKRVRGQRDRAEYLLTRTEYRSLREGRPRELRGSGRADYTDVDAETFERRIRELERAHVDDRTFLLGIVEAWRAVENLPGEKRRWVEKTPQSEIYIHTWNRWFGRRAVYLHIVRDPRDTFVSHRAKRANVTLDRFCLDWARSLEAGRWASSRFSNYHFMRYEDLVTETRESMAAAADWLGIDFDECLLHPTRVGRPWLGNSMSDKAYQGVSRSSIKRYADVLSEAERETLECRLRPQMEAFGYTCATGPTAETDAFQRRLAWALCRWRWRSRLPFLLPAWRAIRGGGRRKEC